MHRPLLTAGLLFALAIIVGAQNSRERALYMLATDSQGQPVIDLRPDEIIVTEDRVRREVLRVSKATEPLDIALLVDNSTAADRHIVSLREALTRFVDALPREYQIAIVGLADRPTLLADYTTDISRLNQGIGRIFAQPMSAMTLLDALVEIPRGMEKRQAVRRAVVAVLTDGPEVGNHDDRSVLKAVLNANVQFHAVTVGTFSTASVAPDPGRYRDIVLEATTRRSGGTRHSLLAATAIPRAMEKLARGLSSQLEVVYARPESLIPPENVAVAVSRPGVTARGTPERRVGG